MVKGTDAQAEPISGAGAGTLIYDVRRFGAKGDGASLDTSALQAAIDACTRDRGGTVSVPAGNFLAGTIELKNNVTLHLAAAARILGSPNINDYRGGASSSNPRGRSALILALEAENVSIEGPGTVDGQGTRFFIGRGDNTGPNASPETGYTQRPHLLQCIGCKNLSIRDVFLTNAAYWCTNINLCGNVRVDGVRIHTRVNVNNDGLHFGSCEHVTVSNCNVECQDDACALFGSMRDVTITNCTFSTRWSVFRFGGGVAENIAISNCVIHDTFGCPIKMQAGGGSRIENVRFANLVMDNVTGPIYVGSGREVVRRGNQTSPGGIVRNLSFEGIRAVVARAPDLTGYPSGKPYPGESKTCINFTSIDGQWIENISLSDIDITYAGGGTAGDAAIRDVPQLSGGEYFECGQLPAYGMYARNLRGLRLHNVRFDLAAPDLRPALVFDRIEDAAIRGMVAPWRKAR